MSNWIEHLDELASVETDVKKKVAFQSSARLIKDLAKGGAELRAELAALRQSIPKIKADAIRGMTENVPLFTSCSLEVNEILEYANKIEDGS